MSDIVQRWRLTSGATVPCVCGCTLVQPTLKQIFFDDADGCIGFDAYQMFLHLMTITIESLIKNSDVPLYNITIYQLFMADPAFRSLFMQALSFFIAEDVVYNEARNVIEIYKDGARVGVVDEEGFDVLRKGILTINHIDVPDVVKPKFKNKAARRIYEKILKGRQDMPQQKADANMNLPNMIEAVCANSPTYNFTNIFSLTVWQLHNQFVRLYSKVQTDIVGVRWAAYGEEPFDFSIWYDDVEQRTKGLPINVPTE